MPTAQSGDTVAVHYTGKHTNGEVFDSSLQRNQPLEFTLGQGQVIKGFENAILGLELNQKVSVTIPCEEAYGPKSEDKLLKVSKEQVPQDMNLKVGDQVQVTDQSGQPIPCQVHALEDAHIVLDANHPMAGKDLVFDIQLLEIK